MTLIRTRHRGERRFWIKLGVLYGAAWLRELLLTGHRPKLRIASGVTITYPDGRVQKLAGTWSELRDAVRRAP